MLAVLGGAATLSAFAAIAADNGAQRHRAFYLLKPLTTLLITGIALLGVPGEYRTLVLVALLLSCLGDICLMFEGNQWFMGGLGSFLLAHIVFVVAYVAGLDRVLPPWWSALFLVYGLGFFGWLLPKTGSLKIPVIVYGASLMGMAITASARWINLGDTAALLALIGAAVFVVSDSSLAVRKFSGPYRNAQLLILSTYWLAIGLIALSTHSL